MKPTPNQKVLAYVQDSVRGGEFAILEWIPANSVPMQDDPNGIGEGDDNTWPEGWYFELPQSSAHTCGYDEFKFPLAHTAEVKKWWYLADALLARYPRARSSAETELSWIKNPDRAGGATSEQEKERLRNGGW